MLFSILSEVSFSLSVGFVGIGIDIRSNGIVDHSVGELRYSYTDNRDDKMTQTIDKCVFHLQIDTERCIEAVNDEQDIERTTIFVRHVT
ncbi:hypothetical protein HCN44_010358 [Aphidius gifuensis]|uniref:Uncharacterized protein n=1 Tax=Aphidius gifuensis TaxID=684658 RepID=A0A834XUJ6_APHGI|nr:hypothetical protein HCN44_010358 [Aphidius gifuensis]